MAFRKASPLRQRLPSVGELSSECETERLSLRRIRHIQHRAEGVEDEALDAVGHQQPLLLGEERHGNSLFEELALTGGQQRAAGAAGGCGAGRELGGVKGVAVAGQPAAGGGELGQCGVDTAALGLHGGQRDGVAAVFEPLLELFRFHLFHREEERKFLLPCAVDELGGVTEAAAGRQQQGDAPKVGGGDAAVAGGDVECARVAEGRADIARRLPVVDAVHSQAVGDEALCLREQPAARDFHRRSGCTAQCLPKLSGSEDGVAVEEQRPCGVGVGHALQRGGGTAVVEGGGAFFVIDELFGGLAGARGVLHEAQAVDLALRSRPAEKKAAGRPVIKVKVSAGKGGGAGQTVGPSGAVKKRFVAGHRAGQRQLGEERLVGRGEPEHQFQRFCSGDAQRAGGLLTGQNGGAVLEGRELHGVGGVGAGEEHPLEREDEILGGDGVVGGISLRGGIGQAVLQIECIGEPVGRYLPLLTQFRREAAVRCAADEAAVEVLAGDDVRGAGRHLRVKVRGDGIHEPGKAVGAGAAGGQAQNEKRSQ